VNPPDERRAAQIEAILDKYGPKPCLEVPLEVRPERDPADIVRERDEEARALREARISRQRAKEAKARAELRKVVEPAREKYARLEMVIEARTFGVNRLSSEGWQSRKGRRQRERRAVRQAFHHALRLGGRVPPLPCIATLRRVGPILMDRDGGLQFSAKTLRDELSHALGARDDADHRGEIEWRYEQTKLWEKCRVRARNGAFRNGLRTFVVVVVEDLVERVAGGETARCDDGAVERCDVPHGCAAIGGYTPVRSMRVKVLPAPGRRRR
jgi:hypothetical protein